METNEKTSRRPSLRLVELAITNFRTFHQRTVIPFHGDAGDADVVAVFHGDNGSGKSNAIAALDLFFQTAVLALRMESEALIPWDKEWSSSGIAGDRPLVLSYLDRPHGIDGPMEIEVCFADPRLGRLRSTCTPSGNQVRVQVTRAHQKEHGGNAGEGEFTPIPKGERDQLFTWLVTPNGPTTRSIAILDARRRYQEHAGEARLSLMPDELVTGLFDFRTSRRPDARAVWRTFVEILRGFEAFRGKEISVEHRPVTAGGGGVPELVVEDRGRAVLALDQLSSGEQQVIVLCASMLLCSAAILAIQEPEISLDYKNQRLFHKIVEDISKGGLVDQVILESHVPTFDGPEVIRFMRQPRGVTEVQRGPAIKDERREIARRAEEQGAKQRWISPDGYTRIPDNMRDELHLERGGHVWFLKGPQHWEAWPEAEVDELFRLDDEDRGDG